MDMRDRQRVEELIGLKYPQLTSEQVLAAGLFFEKLVQENQVQNLTRLISPEDFVEGHLEDVMALRASGLVDFPAMDLGSGGGVPGLLYGAIWGDSWVLCESERRKADFLSKTTQEMGLKNIEVFAGRGEDFLKGHKVKAIVARAVGPVARIYAWIEKCSTWNTLVLLKGPGWDQEWIAFSQSRFRGRLVVGGEFKYQVGKEKMDRRILRLDRATGR